MSPPTEKQRPAPRKISTRIASSAAARASSSRSSPRKRGSSRSGLSGRSIRRPRDRPLDLVAQHDRVDPDSHLPSTARYGRATSTSVPWVAFGGTQLHSCHGIVGSWKTSSLLSSTPASCSRRIVAGTSGVVKQTWWTCSPRLANRWPSGVSGPGCMSWISGPPWETNVAQRIVSPPASNCSYLTIGSASCSGSRTPQDLRPILDRPIEVLDQEADVGNRIAGHRVSFSRRRRQPQGPADDLVHDLVGATVDPLHARVAPQPRDLVLVHVSVAAVQLHAAIETSNCRSVVHALAPAASASVSSPATSASRQRST